MVEDTRNPQGIHQESWYGIRTTRNPPGIHGAVESSERKRNLSIILGQWCSLVVQRNIVDIYSLLFDKIIKLNLYDMLPVARNELPIALTVAKILFFIARAKTFIATLMGAKGIYVLIALIAGDTEKMWFLKNVYTLNQFDRLCWVPDVFTQAKLLDKSINQGQRNSHGRQMVMNMVGHIGWRHNGTITQKTNDGL